MSLSPLIPLKWTETVGKSAFTDFDLSTPRYEDFCALCPSYQVKETDFSPSPVIQPLWTKVHRVFND